MTDATIESDPDTSWIGVGLNNPILGGGRDAFVAFASSRMTGWPSIPSLNPGIESYTEAPLTVSIWAESSARRLAGVIGGRVRGA